MQSCYTTTKKRDDKKTFIMSKAQHLITHADLFLQTRIILEMRLVCYKGKGGEVASIGLCGYDSKGEKVNFFLG